MVIDLKSMENIDYLPSLASTCFSRFFVKFLSCCVLAISRSVRAVEVTANLLRCN